MIRIITQHTWQLALLEIRKLKSERDSLRGAVDRLTRDVVALREELEEARSARFPAREGASRGL